MQHKQEVVQRYIHFYNSFKINEMAELFTEDCLFQNVSNSGGSLESRGKENFLKLAMQSKELFQERKQTVTN